MEKSVSNKPVDLCNCELQYKRVEIWHAAMLEFFVLAEEILMINKKKMWEIAVGYWEE